MHNIYFARHGETVWNVENKICGMLEMVRNGIFPVRKAA